MIGSVEKLGGCSKAVINTADGGYEWYGVASLLAQDIQASMRLDYTEVEFGECILLRKGEPMPEGLSLNGEWQYVVVLHIKSGDRERILDDISQFNDTPVEPFLSGEYAVWQFPHQSSQCLKASPRIATTVFLPKWLTNYIYGEKQLAYRTDCKAVQYNLRADDDFSFQYLATYFPRTFAEVTAIFDYVFSVSQTTTERLGDTVSILDVGCGSGAAAIALLWSLKKTRIGCVKKVAVTGLDGNQNFLNRFTEMLPTIRKIWPSVDVVVEARRVDMMENALQQCPARHYDFVVSSKFIQELTRCDAYEWALSVCMAKVATGGTLFFLENYRNGRTERNCNYAHSIRNAHVETEPMKEFSIRQILECTCVCETIGYQLFVSVEKENNQWQDQCM